ncbi:hypothetical protein [Mycolicibacterium lutetiense]|uniref:Uncharacterized protein n=1 Tax=Mycolicibacterium lutetiense TaxID=1641992 RepID=A0ABS4ZS27_9MYCO|nr:hypothetical protein [Mycolicibacterium lutetiense]MBP2452308.1 hypothetical protein [Mycolicibacterium lutetiense]
MSSAGDRDLPPPPDGDVGSPSWLHTTLTSSTTDTDDVVAYYGITKSV